MGRIVDLPSLKPRSTRHRQGLRTLSPDLISKARDETGTQVTRIGLTFLGTTAFCLLSLLSPDSAILGGNEKINVPLAGPVSFFGFMLLGPTVLIVLRVYLQIYVEHSDRLDRLARSVSAVRAPALVPLRNPLIRVLSGVTFYLLLPVAMMLFAWKAAVFPAWGAGLFAVAEAVIVGHVMLPFRRFSWPSRGLLSVGVAMIAGGLMLGGVWFGFEPLRRPFNLYHANLSGQWLAAIDLHNANLSHGNLGAANLSGANLSGATLFNANLIGANLSGATLSTTKLIGANLSGTNLVGAHLGGAILLAANLSDANLGKANLSNAKLPSADLSNAHLLGANLSGANLGGANLTGAILLEANLTGAELSGANLTGAILLAANLSDAKLPSADLSKAKNLTQTQLDKACGNANTKLPEGLKLKWCSKD
jgi:uncharacterized protein YjbI with pentapeptide repeats